ncbi:MAG: CPBP family intramembrane metalloprotease [Candidatus Brennerbacteria bacterium]|nr:CPBP family intramembrane metalloprotease [Candidatus Brennerbacteria bacterium]
MIKKWQNITGRIEPWWTLVGAPVAQEFVFRFVPYQIYVLYGGFYAVGIISSLLFAAIHWYFGKWFVLYTFVGGLVAWFVMVSYGFLWAVILHVVANAVLLRLGILQKVKRHGQ